MEFDKLLKYFIGWQCFFYPKSLILCPKMFMPFEYIDLEAIYIIIPGYYRVRGNKCPFSL